MKIGSRKVFTVEGLDETFDTEAQAAAASIMMLLEIPCEMWDDVLTNLRENGDQIQQRLKIVMEPRNRKGN